MQRDRHTSAAGSAHRGALRRASLVLAGAVVFLSLTASGADFGEWERKWKIAFTGYRRAEVLTNFPALVTISPSLTNFTYRQFASPVGNDLRFSAADSATELNYEIEKWDTNGTSYVWVQVPALASNSHIFAYWGKAGASKPAYTTNGATWSAGYAGVWHLNGPDATGLRDSTANGNHLVNGGSAQFTASGKVGYGMRFDGGGADNHYASVPALTSYSTGSEPSTMSTWVFVPQYPSEWRHVLSLQSQANNLHIGIRDQFPSHKLEAMAYTGADHLVPADSVYQTGVWLFLAYAYDGTTLRFYVNGQIQNGGSGARFTPTYSLPAIFSIARQYPARSPANSMKCTQDEVRLSRRLRSANWLWASWTTVASNATFASSTEVPTTSLRVGNASVPEGSSGRTVLTLPVILTQASRKDVAVRYATSNDTAIAGGDFIATNGTLRIPAGETNALIRIGVVGDTRYEGESERFYVVLSNASNAGIARAIGECTILEDDPPPRMDIGDAMEAEGNAGEPKATFKITLSAVAGVDATAAFATEDGTAFGWSDYVPTNGVVTIPAGQLSRTIQVPILPDTTYEASETFGLRLSAPTNATLGDALGQGNILNDDSAPQIRLDDAQLAEGHSASASMYFRVWLSEASGVDVLGAYFTSNGTAEAGADFDAVSSGQARIPAGAFESWLAVQVRGDILDEGVSENFTVRLRDVANATVVDGEATGTILDDDVAALSVADAWVHEGHAGVTSLVFTVTTPAARLQDITARFVVSNGTAQAGSDYVATNGLLRIAPGETNGTIVVRVLGDVDDEPLFETLNLYLFAPTNAALADPRAVGTLIDDEGPVPELRVRDVAVTEGDAAPVAADFLITLSGSTWAPVTVRYATSNGTAQAGTDYVAAAGVATVPIGQTSVVVTVIINGDPVDEPDQETFFLNLSDATNATLADSQAMGTIHDNDASPRLSIHDMSVNEGDAGSQVASFSLSLDRPSAYEIQVRYATADDTAQAGLDYGATNGVLRIPPMTTAANLPVVIFGDLEDEGDFERFTMTLSAPSNAVLAIAQARGTILDNEITPLMWIEDVVVQEGNSGHTYAVFVVRVSNVSPWDVTVGFTTSNGTARAGQDFAATNGTLRIPAGQDSATIPVAVLGDLVDEGTQEQFFLALTNVSGAILSDPLGVCTVFDDDEPIATVAGSHVREGHAGQTNAIFRVTLSAVGVLDVTIHYATSNGTAVAGADFVATNGVLRIPAGQTNGQIVVRVIGDRMDEADTETYEVVLRNATNAALSGPRAQGVIEDDDAPPTLAIADAAVLEGNAGATNAAFVVSLSAASGLEVSVPFAVSNGTALAGADYTATNGTLTIPAGRTNALLLVRVLGDRLNEADAETFTVHLGAPANATLGDGLATGQVLDDDPAPQVSVAEATVTEGHAGRTNAIFAVRLNALAGLDVIIRYTTSNGTARAGTDYSATTDTLTISAGQTNGQIVVPVFGDTHDEGVSENFYVRLLSVSNGTAAASTARGTILDDDAPPTLTVHDTSAVEGHTGSRPLTFRVSLVAVSDLQVTVPFSTSNGTATAGVDYAATNGLLAFDAGVTSRTVTVTLFGDRLFEGVGEDLFLVLGAPTNATLAVPAGRGTITEDDPPPVASIRSATVPEGDLGRTNAAFVVTLNAAAGTAVSLVYATSNGTAIAGADFLGTNGVLVIPPGETNGVIVVPVFGDLVFEGVAEEFRVHLLEATNATLGTTAADGRILDDDGAPKMTIHDAAADEGHTGLTRLDVSVTLNAASVLNVGVAYATRDGTALAGRDYLATNGVLVIPAGETNGTIQVRLVGDTIFEGAGEAFSLRLSDASNATILVGTSQTTIRDDDAPPALFARDAAMMERDGGVTTLVFAVALVPASEVETRVAYATSNGTATAGLDYTATNGVLAIPAGETNGLVLVPVLPDAYYEGPFETLHLLLSAPTNATLADDRAEGRLLESQPPPELTIHDGSVVEGNAGVTNLPFRVTLSKPVVVDVTVHVVTSNGTALAGSDYQAASTTVTIRAGSTSAVARVAVIGDTRDEGAEEIFHARLRAPTNAVIAAGQATGTIVDDDGMPFLTVSDPVVIEGDFGTRRAQFNVNLSVASGVDVTARFATSNGTATAGSDYVATNGIIRIQAGRTSGLVLVTVLGDLLDEGLRENFFLVLSAVTNAVAADPKGEATIQDDDVARLTVQPATVREGHTGTTNAIFAYSLDQPSPLAISVRFATSNGTATAGSDYVATNGTLRLAPGVTNGTLRVTVRGDRVYEGVAETYGLYFPSISNVALTATTAVGTILDDDNPPSLWIGDITVVEGNFGVTYAVFPITLSAAPGLEVSVSFDTANGTAEAGADYLATNGVLVIPAGVGATELRVPILGDTADEGFFETFSARVFAPSGVVIADGDAECILIDDDTVPLISVEGLMVQEGNLGGTNVAWVPVRLSVAAGENVTVEYATSNGTALAGADYAPRVGTLVITAGTEVAYISVPIVGDVAEEGAFETFTMHLTRVIGATVAGRAATIAIIDDDVAPILAIDDVVIAEGDSGFTNAQFIVRMNVVSPQDTFVDFATSNGTATAGADYRATNGTLRIQAGRQTATITVRVFGDAVVEGASENFFVRLRNPIGAALLDDLAECTIVDEAPYVSIAPAVVREGHVGQTNAAFLVSLNYTTRLDVAIAYTTSNGVAEAGSDFVSTAGRLVIRAGQRSGTVTIPVVGDLLYEGVSESFYVRLLAASNATINAGVGLGTILDDDEPPRMWIEDVAVVELDNAPTPAQFNVRLSAPAGVPVSVRFATTNGTAEAGSDYAPTNGWLTLPPGDVAAAVVVSVLGDIVDEPDVETFRLLFTRVTNAVLADAAAVGTIVDDDSVPLISIHNAVLVEGDDGLIPADFVVTLSAPSAQDVSVEYATSNGTADAGSDYVGSSGLLTIPAGQRSGLISVPVRGDTRDEGDSETFYVTLARPANAVLAASRATGVIVDDDADQPQVWVGDVTVVETDSGATNALFAVTLSEPIAGDVLVTFATSNGTALAGSDYTATNGTLRIPAGRTNGFVRVAVLGDRLGEPPAEDFFVNLLNATGATLAGRRGRGTILDNDTPFLTVGDVTVKEGDFGVTNAQFVIRLSVTVGVDVVVVYTTSNGTAEAGADYAATNGTAVIRAGSRETRIRVRVFGDTSYEGDSERFYLRLLDATNAPILVAVGECRIMDDDRSPLLWIQDATVLERDSGATNAVFTVQLSSPVGTEVTVDYATANGTAVAVRDYRATSGRLRFAPGQTVATIAVAVLGDRLDEGAFEQFIVTLARPVNAVLADAEGQATIIDDDDPPFLSVDDTLVVEGDAGTTNAVFVVRLSAASGLNVQADYATADGSARGGLDYTPNAGTLVIPAGATEGRVEVRVTGDTFDEGVSEQFRLLLSRLVNAGAADVDALGTIIDDEDPPFLWVSDATVKEPTAGRTNALFVLHLSEASGLDVLLNFATRDGTARAGADYRGTNGAVRIPAGMLAWSIPVAVLSDALNEGVAETFSLDLSGVVNALMLDDSAQGTILDDAPFLTVRNATVREGHTGVTNALFQVSLNTPSTVEVAVDYVTRDGTATAAADYTGVAGRLRIPPGQTAAQIAVPVLGDTRYERAGEVFYLDFTRVTNAALLTARATGTIEDDDPMPALRVEGVSVVEQNAGFVNAGFRVVLNTFAGVDVTARFATTNDTARAGTDYIGTNGTVRVRAGFTNAMVIVRVRGDILDEGDSERFGLRLFAPTNATIAVARAEGTILDDDPTPFLAVGNAMRAEGDRGSAPATFRLTLSAPSGLEVAVNFATSNGTATAGADYVATNGTLRIPAGQSTGTVAVAVLGDTLDEGGYETFYLTLRLPVNVVLTGTRGEGTIVDDDEANPLLWVTDATTTEGDFGVTAAVFRVSLAAPATREVALRFDTSNGTARAGSDYVATNGVLRIGVGAAQGFIRVGVLGDTTYEGASEQFFLRLLSASNASPVATFARGTIVEDDAATPVIRIADAAVTEGNTGRRTMVFPVSLGAIGSLPVRVNYATSNGTAVAGVDYLPTNGVLVIAAGSLTGRVSVLILGDSRDESPFERFYVRLFNPTNAPIADGLAVGTILDDDRDGDRDGLNDDWEIAYFRSTNAVNGGPLDDWDRDGADNESEQTAGTDPTDPTDVLAVTSVSYEPTAGRWTLSWPTELGRLYTLETAIGLGRGATWAVVPGWRDLAGTGGTMSYVSTVPGTRVFFRVRVVWP